MNFDPNNKTQPVIEWATYCPGRSPEFKTHKQKNHARNAAGNRSNAILYKWIGGQWVEVYRHENLPRHIDCSCGRTQYGRPAQCSQLNWVDLRDEMDYVWAPCWLCRKDWAQEQCKHSTIKERVEHRNGGTEDWNVTYCGNYGCGKVMTEEQTA